MIDVLLAIAITGTLFIVVGAPFAVSVRGRSEGWIALATDALLMGLVVVPLAITAWTIFSWWGIALAVALEVAFVLLAVRARAGLPGRPTRPPLALAATWIAVIVVAVALRAHNTNFLPWVGDMGAYVNWANEFVRSGVLQATWPPVYSTFLSVSGAIFGPEGTAAGIAVTGIAFIAVIARVLTLLALNRWVIVGVAGLIALNVHSIWYSTFPSSESLNAPIFVLWASLVMVLLRSRVEQLPAVIGVTFLVMLNLCLLRGSGSFLLAPALILAVASIAIPAWRVWAPRLWAFFLASLVAAQVGVWYGVSVIPRYFVDMQLGFLTPDSVFNWGKSVGLFEPGPLLFAVLVAMLAVASVGLVAAVRLRNKPAATDDRATRILAYLAAGALLVLLVLALVVGSNIWAIFWRSGIWIALVPVATLVMIARRKHLSDDVPLVFLLVTTSLLLTVFHSFRVGNDRIHAFFIYWDRYLFSEVIPALIVVAAIGASAAVAALAHNRRVERLAAIPAVVTAAAVIAVSAPHAVAVARISQDTYMDGAFEFTERLAAYATDENYTLWAATAAEPAPDFFFPNTWMAFAVPLERTFGFEFSNVKQGGDNFRPDAVITEPYLKKVLAKHDNVLVYETQTANGRPLDERLGDRFEIERVGEETSDISLLPQGPGLREWDHATIDVVVWRVGPADR